MPDHPSFHSPIRVRVYRGDALEVQHRAAICVVRGDDVVLAHGDVGARYFLRSSAKFFQAVPFVTSGAFDHHGFGTAELALACASHSGEVFHVETARRMLAAGGLTEEDLQCGCHPPLGKEAHTALIRAGVEPTALHNNCSGKHAAMLLGALARGETTDDYLDPTHPLQREIATVLLEFAGATPDDLGIMIDGCSAPTFQLPLDAAARAFAAFGAPPARVAPDRRAAAERIRTAIIEHPEMIAGTGRFCTAIVEATGGRVFAKIGADGFYGAFCPEERIGIALHVDDGSWGMSERLMLSLLERGGFLSDADLERLATWRNPTRLNHAGLEVGRISIDWPDDFDVQ